MLLLVGGVGAAAPSQCAGQGQGNTKRSYRKKLTQGFDADFYLPACEPVTQELQSALFVVVFFFTKW